MNMYIIHIKCILANKNMKRISNRFFVNAETEWNGMTKNAYLFRNSLAHTNFELISII